MKKTLLATSLFFTLHPLVVLAHDTSGQFFRPEPVVSDLNAITVRLAKETLSNADVLIISSVGCATARVAIRDEVGAKARTLLADYPTADEIGAIEAAAFIDYERDAFSAYGANEAALHFLTQRIEVEASVPSTSPAEDSELKDELLLMEEITCDVRAKTPKNLAENAGKEEKAYAQAVGKAVLGIGAIVADGAITVETGGVGAAIFGIVSGGWGWNRVEEAVPVLKKLWDSVF